MQHQPSFDPRPVTLTGEHARLEPLTEAHLPDLLEQGRDEEIWRYMPMTAFRSLVDARTWFDQAMRDQDTGEQIPFAIIHRASGRAVGSTRFLEIRREHRGLEIGWTWIGPDFQRTALNTECKRLLLGHAFDDLGAIRVQFKTDSRNQRSQRAIERIGGVREGVLHNHMIMPDGVHRHSVYFSITIEQWPNVKARLVSQLNRENKTVSGA